MTPSTQGSGVIAFRCGSPAPTVVIGVNSPAFRPRDAAGAELEYQIGSGKRRRASASAGAEGTLELDARASAAIIERAAKAPNFTFYLPQAGDEALRLVFRPVETGPAVEKLRESCRKAGSG
jgi:hypothetical protein